MLQPHNCLCTCHGSRTLNSHYFIPSPSVLPSCSDFRKAGFSCERSLSPVCGSDGRTYTNACEMARITCQEGRRVGIKHEGQCQSQGDEDLRQGNGKKRESNQSIKYCCRHLTLLWAVLLS